MSTVVAWATDEGTGNIGSCYLASDSRITGGQDWDYGQKVFALKKGGIMAYVGNVLFPTQILSQLIDLIDRELIYQDDEPNNQKAEKIFSYLSEATTNYFQSLKNTIVTFILVKDKKFDLYEIHFAPNKLIFEEIIPGQPFVYGSGKKSFDKAYNKLNLKDKRNVNQNVIDEKVFSRYIFQALVTSVVSGVDVMSGGNIQIAGLYKNGVSQPFGYIKDKKMYLYGLEIAQTDSLSNIQWRNEKFEVCDPIEKRVKLNGQIQPFHPSLKD